MSFYVSHFSKRLPRPAEPKQLAVVGYVHDDVSGDKEIEGLVKKNEMDKKIIELFKAQLLLPINKRSKALMDRFGIDVAKNGQVDAWPSTKTDVKFHVNAYWPVDSTIHENARLAGAKTKVVGLFVEKSTGNTFYYHFPVSMRGVTEDNVLKLDNLNTWIYRDTGEPLVDQGDLYNIYHALLDQIKERNLEQSNEFLKSLGMYTEANGVTYTLKNRNIRVESAVRNSGNSALNLLKQQATSTPAAAVSDGELNIELEPVMLNDSMKIDEQILEMPLSADVDLPEEILGKETPGETPGELPISDDTLDQTETEIVVTPVATTTTTTTGLEPADEEKTDPEPEPEPEEDKKGRYSIQEIIQNPKYKDLSPFDKLALKFPDFDVQFTSCSTRGYVPLKKPHFVMQNIDRGNKLVKVVVHDYAHHTHIRDGEIDVPDLFRKYNEEFILAGNKEKAMVNINSAKDRLLLEKRMKPYRFTDYTSYKL